MWRVEKEMEEGQAEYDHQLRLIRKDIIEYNLC